jgi:hypothetical protein
MVDGNHNSNGRWQRQWQWAIAAVTATAMAIAMVTAIAMESATMTEMATAMAMAMATARATIKKEGLPLHEAAMCSTFGGVTPCLHPHGHKGKCIHQRNVMGVTLLRVFAPFQGGGVPDSSPWIVFLFIFYNYCSVY